MTIPGMKVSVVGFSFIMLIRMNFIIVVSFMQLPENSVELLLLFMLRNIPSIGTRENVSNRRSLLSSQTMLTGLPFEQIVVFLQRDESAFSPIIDEVMKKHKEVYLSLQSEDLV
jgi:hypothetical protein